MKLNLLKFSKIYEREKIGDEDRNSGMHNERMYVRTGTQVSLI